MQSYDVNKDKEWGWKLKGVQWRAPGMTLLNPQLECWNFRTVCGLHVDYHENGHTHPHTHTSRKEDRHNKQRTKC